ncbi:unnamed protein product, partial [Rotaria magnacalcarata]
RVIHEQVKATRDEQNQMLNYLDCIMGAIKTIGGTYIRMPKQRHLGADDSTPVSNPSSLQLHTTTATFDSTISSQPPLLFQLYSKSVYETF